jgi:hypothetical protein
MKRIKLGGKKGKGKYAIVDDSDYKWLSGYNWSFTAKGYANVRIDNRTVLMHRLIMNTPEGMDTDHKNNNGLDNQRHNLRIATVSQNKMNIGKKVFKGGSSSKYKGVCLRKTAKVRKWRCNVGVIELGSFETEIEAAMAYDKRAKELYGEFVILNFPDKK